MTAEPRTHAESDEAPAIAPATEVRNWLGRFAHAVRSRDYHAGRGMFDPAALGFGTVAPRADGLDALAKTQWERVWSRTAGFGFDLDHATIAVEGELAWAAVEWTSTGFHGKAPVQRTGRATIVLRWRTDAWYAIHTHFSRTPGEEGSPV